MQENVLKQDKAEEKGGVQSNALRDVELNAQRGALK